uniref:Uncharacterized protein n=1 Tax=Sphenodon punctatus TaxID=8508 RepID=A0A8D0GYT7_SPHPU
PNDFRIYTYSPDGYIHPKFPRIQNDCYYQGYIAGFPNSVVTLSICSGLRGILQFENVSYGIEPLVSSPGFEHLVYQIKDENREGPLSAGNYNESGREKIRRVSYKLYLETYIILDKALMFIPLNMTIVLSSLEFWSNSNKIHTTGEADELLQRFLQWKNSHLVLRPHDLAYLLAYRDEPDYVGAAFAGKMCVRNYDAGVALYQPEITLETFSVIIAQLLGLSLGMEYDDARDCQCPGSICIMNTEAIYSNGVKSFSSCSIGDFESFIKHRKSNCLSNRPPLYLSYKQLGRPKTRVCGNRIVEPGEICDCGTAEECKKDKCCSETCTLKPGAKCSTGLCCHNCQVINTKCRLEADDECDISEYCNGTSGFCPPDIYVQNGHRCSKNTGFCYNGYCGSPDIECRNLYGKGKCNNSFLICFKIRF